MNNIQPLFRCDQKTTVQSNKCSNTMSLGGQHCLSNSDCPIEKGLMN